MEIRIISPSNLQPFYLVVTLMHNFKVLNKIYTLPVRTYGDIDDVLDDILKFIKPSMRY